MASNSDMVKIQTRKSESMNSGMNQGIGTNPVELMKYKAAKYHYKIHSVLNDRYVSQGIPVPKGYDQYLQPFDS